MLDVITYAILKKAVNSAVTGINKVEYKNGKLIFTLADNTIIETPLDMQESNVKNIFLNNENSLVVEFHDNTNLIIPIVLDSMLHPIAKSGNINDIVQSKDDIIIIDCGNAGTKGKMILGQGSLNQVVLD